MTSFFPISNHWRRRLAAGALYALLIGVLLLPGATHLTTRLIGNNIDNWIFYWNDWWLEIAIREGRDWLFTPYAFFPQGTSLLTHSNSFLTSLLALPFRPWLGAIGAYNIALMLGLWLSALGMFLLIDEMTGAPQAALCAGFVFAFAPYHLTQSLAHAHLGGIHWWPFYALCLRRALNSRQRSVASMVGAGVFAALTLWTGLQLAVLLVLWSLLYAGWRLLSCPRAERRAGIGALAIIGGVALLLSLPLLIPLARAWEDVTAATTHFQPGMRDQTDLLAYALPPTYHPWWGAALSPIYERFVANRAYMPYLGYGALALAVLALAQAWRHARFWGISAAVWITLAAGSALRFNGQVYPGIPLPYRWLAKIFPISTLRAPDRFNLLVVFSLAVLVGLGAARLIAAGQRKWLLPLALLLLIEYLCLPIPVWAPPPDSPFYAQMAAEPPDYGVVSYPPGYTNAKLWLYYQTRHEKPLVEAHLSRYSLDTYATILDNAVLRALYQPTLTQLPPLLPAAPFEAQPTPVPALGPSLRALDELGVRYLLAHLPYADAETMAHLRRVLPFVPRYADATLHVYDLRAPFARRYEPWPAPLSPALALARFDVQHDEAGERWRFGVMMVASTAGPPPRRCEIALEPEAGGEATITMPLTFFAAPTMWQVDDMDYQEASLTLPRTDLEANVYRWALRCEDASVYRAPETLTVMQTPFTFTYLRERVDATFGDEIRLRGYRWRTEGATLRLALWWETLASPAMDYKVFAHLLNAEGKLVAQHDAMPCGWACPTGSWSPGQRLIDEAPIFLGDVPPGTYHLSVGLYDPTTGARLPAFDSQGDPYPQDAAPFCAPLRIIEDGE